ncbi:MAG: hypothetical protein ABIO16_07085 [Nocardioides sp.]
MGAHQRSGAPRPDDTDGPGEPDLSNQPGAAPVAGLVEDPVRT